MAIVLPKFPRGSVSAGNSNREGSCPILTRLCGLRPSYRPQEVIQFEVMVNSPVENLNAVEVSVIWFTQGKGTEDLGVHFFRRIAGPQLGESLIDGRLSIETELPDGPLSYRGQILKISWATRVRLFFANGEESHFDRPFLLENAVVDKS